MENKEIKQALNKLKRVINESKAFNSTPEELYELLTYLSMLKDTTIETIKVVSDYSKNIEKSQYLEMAIFDKNVFVKAIKRLNFLIEAGYKKLPKF